MNLKNKIYIIAEIGVNHNGNIVKGIRLKNLILNCLQRLGYA